MSKIKLFFLNLFYREEGASALEYALLAAMVAVAIAAFVTDINTGVTNIFTTIKNTLTPT